MKKRFGFNLFFRLGSTIALAAAITSLGQAQQSAYVTNQTSHNVSVIDTATNTEVFRVGSSRPAQVAIAPDGTRVYVVGRHGFLSVIDTATNTEVFPRILLGSRPWGVAITPDGNRAYVTNFFSGDVSVIDTATNTEVLPRIPVGSLPSGIAIMPEPSTPEDRTEALADDVEELLTGGILNDGQANSLGSKLENILQALEQRKTKPVINQLNAFINQVLSLVDEGVLTPEEGQDLVDAAQAVIDQLSE